MASVHDVAAYILAKLGEMTAMKLQKLVYYSQAWGLVWDERPLFQARIEAWANGPVVPTLYKEHRGQFKVDRWQKGDQSNLTASERATINGVLEFYGPKTSQWLSDLTHAERPWREARGTLPAGERGNQVISHASMHEYYSGLSGSQRIRSARASATSPRQLQPLPNPRRPLALARKPSSGIRTPDGASPC